MDPQVNSHYQHLSSVKEAIRTFERTSGLLVDTKPGSSFFVTGYFTLRTSEMMLWIGTKK
jgi:hypothetical protein